MDIPNFISGGFEAEQKQLTKANSHGKNLKYI